MSHLARVFRNPSLQQQDRLPVSSLDEAVRRLVMFRSDPSISDEAYDLAIRVVADIFWVHDLRLRRDVIVAVRQIGGEA